MYRGKITSLYQSTNLAYRRPPNIKDTMVRADCKIKTITNLQPQTALATQCNAQQPLMIVTKHIFITRFLTKPTTTQTLNTSASLTHLKQRDSWYSFLLTNIRMKRRNNKRVCTNKKAPLRSSDPEEQDSHVQHYREILPMQVQHQP